MISREFEKTDSDAEPEGEDVIGVDHQLAFDGKVHIVPLAQQYLSALRLVLQCLHHDQGVQGCQLDRECLECVLRQDVVLYRILKLILAECHTHHPLSLIVYEGCRQNRSQDHVPVEAQFVYFPKFFDVPAYRIFQIILNSNDVECWC